MELLVKSVNAELKEQPKSFKIQAFIVTSPSILHTAYSIDIIIYAHLSVEALFSPDRLTSLLRSAINIDCTGCTLRMRDICYAHLMKENGEEMHRWRIKREWK